MTKHIIDLAGSWQITGFAPDEDTPSLTVPGCVPGQVHVDLEAAGHISPPFWRDQADECQWVETWGWRYSREFTLPEDFPADWAMLEFDGLDTFARVALNGAEVGRTDNMFIPHRFEVGALLRPGTNRIEVHFTAPREAIAGKPYDSFSACFSQDRVRVRRMQCGFGWDWVHRFVTMGIWRPVRLAAYDGGRIADVFVDTQSLDGDAAQLRVHLDVERRCDVPLSAQVELLSPDGACVYRGEMPDAADTHGVEVTLPDTALWWPNGQGDQPLYTCRTTLTASDGAVVDERDTPFGIRTVAIEEISDDLGSSFTLVINGRKVFAKGGNWVPADAFPARIRVGKYERLLGLARDGHVNMLRSWGGGIYEPEAFWNACDRMGIMVLQDFLLACAEYPEQEQEFLDALRVEFAAAIRQFRNHPSLIVWSGDNELGMNSPPESAYNGRVIAEAVSGPLCAELDPSRPFLPTSPYGGAINNAPNAGDCHISAWYHGEFLASDMTDYRARIRDRWGRFMSEYVTVGMAPLDSLRKFADESDLRDPEARILEYHNKDNPYNGIDDATHFQLLRRTAERLYGADPDPLVMLRRMEYVQYEFVRLATESARFRKFDCSGILFWMYNDCWPANGLALVDYWGFAKAGYYAMKRAFQPVIACLELKDDAVGVWAVNDSPEPVPASLSLRSHPWSGPATWTETLAATVPANGAVFVADVAKARLDAQGVLVCDLEGPGCADRAVFYDGMPRDMVPPEAGIRIDATREATHGVIHIATESFARVVTLEADVDFSDNYFDLLPGEERTITWRDVGEPFAGAIRVSCWNGREAFEC